MTIYNIMIIITKIIFIIICCSPIIILIILSIKSQKKNKKQIKEENIEKHNQKTVSNNCDYEMQSIETEKNTYTEYVENEEKSEIKENFKFCPYEKKNLLSNNERAFYKRLKQITPKYNLCILSKVRLEDIIKVKNNLNPSEKASARGRIKSRHVDFVLADENELDVKLLIELDDSSHRFKKAKEIDIFKNKLFEDVDLPYIRTYGYEEIETLICKKLKITKK